MLISQLFIFLCFDYFYYLHFVNCTIWSRAVAYFYKSHLQSRVGTLICFSGLLDKYILGQFANFWYNASHWHHIFQIGLFNCRRHLDQLLLCIPTCTSGWLSLKHPLETNSCWQHVTLTSCQHVYLKKNSRTPKTLNNE